MLCNGKAATENVICNSAQLVYVGVVHCSTDGGINQEPSRDNVGNKSNLAMHDN
jgi:hypothetical protein